MADDARITVRLSAAHLARLDDLAADAGITRSLALRRLLEASAGPHTVAPLDRDDLLGLLEERARAGSAPAIRKLLARADQEEQLQRLNALTRSPSPSTEEPHV